MSRPDPGTRDADRWFTDTTASTRFPVYTRSNANDVLPAPVSPMGVTMTWKPGVLEGWRRGYVRNGSFTAEELAGDNPTGGFFNGYFYVNASVVRVFGERSGAGAAAIDTAFFGNRHDTPPHVAHPDDRSEAAAAHIADRVAWVLSVTEWPELDDSKREADATRASRPDLASLSDAELVARARALIPVLARMFDDHVITSANTAIGPAVISSLVDPALMLRLVASAGDVDSAMPSFALWELSRRVRTSPELTAAFDAGIGGVVDALGRSNSEDSRAFLAAWSMFLLEYGARGPNEWDPHSDVWETRPTLALALLDRMRGADDGGDPRHGHAAAGADREAATAEAMTVLADAGGGEEVRQTLLAAQGSAVRFMGWRERSKTNCVKVLHEQRVALLELGRRHADAGQLGHPKQIFLLAEDELDAYRADPEAYRRLLDEREQAWLALADLEPPYFVEGDKGVPSLSSLRPRGERDVETAVAGETLEGAPGCSGVARGVARVLLDPSDPMALEPGDVLVAPQTDPSWTPLFVAAAGVVVDVGAMNSHAVIVSRELGIPCVVAVADASRRIPDGAEVEVDGGAGTVRVLSVPT